MQHKSKSFQIVFVEMGIDEGIQSFAVVFFVCFLCVSKPATTVVQASDRCRCLRGAERFDCLAKIASLPY